MVLFLLDNMWNPTRVSTNLTVRRVPHGLKKTIWSNYNINTNRIQHHKHRFGFCIAKYHIDWTQTAYLTFTFFLLEWNCRMTTSLGKKRICHIAIQNFRKKLQLIKIYSSRSSNTEISSILVYKEALKIL